MELTVPHTVHSHPHSVTVRDADELLDFPVERLLKTIAFRVRNRGWVLAGVLGYQMVDYKRLGAALGVNRTQLTSLSPDEVQDELGYVIGGVAPFAPNAQTTVVLDEGILRHQTIYCGTGSADRTLEIAPADLVAAAGAQVAPIARKPFCEG